MDNEIVLSAKELYYLGKLMQARNIDYSYIAAMDDVGKNYSVFESESEKSLSDKGCIEEDFAGEKEVNPVLECLLEPVFFGEREVSVNVCTVGEEPVLNRSNFHFFEDNITAVDLSDDTLKLTAADDGMIRKFVHGILPENYSVECRKDVKVEKEMITRLIIVKSATVGKGSVIRKYIEADGTLFGESDSGLESMTKEMFVDEVYSLFKGGN